ncbi:Inositol phoshorylceramide synthase regulatory subunit kei1 [Cytospora mali]|uniref:Inositol phoshorylceramide synthase regulatory subunit kei1 n=1 Tax=Cytospora mali TaxID=578113 RepID=A0A194UU30_CYTMA|nr:Inositol phoshorylceramide synthase regulatory subunit kei1 [Valsa mali var. pyri (nom. inval.)]
MATSRGLRLGLPKPKTFLGLMSLQTGTEMISIALLINKVTGLYGLLAILTGYSLNIVQLSMYIYSVVVLVTLAILIPHIRRQSPFQNLSLAWLYVFDTATNAAYTAAFAAEWYLKSGGNPEGDAAEQATDTAASMVLIVAFTLIRVYLMFVVMSFTRQVMHQYTLGMAVDKGEAVQPFAVGSPEGEGWKGKLGRAMVFVGQDYWIGGREDEEWATSQRAPLAAAFGDYE